MQAPWLHMDPRRVAETPGEGGGVCRAHGRMLLGLAETLTQIHSRPHVMAIIQNDTLKRTHWLHLCADNAALWPVNGELS